MNTIRRVWAPLAACCAVLGLGGCGYLFGDDGFFRDSSGDYQRAAEPPVIAVPEGKAHSALEPIYPIPEVSESVSLNEEFEVPRPTPLVSGSAAEAVRIQSLGDERWALVAMPPGQLWPQVRGFLAAAGLQLGRVDARAGIIETQWLELDGQTVASRFRYRIEQGVQRGSSELHVLQMYQTGDGVSWPQRSESADQEGEMLKAVAQFIANSADSAPVSMIADQAMSASGKIFLRESPQGYSYISVGLSFSRAWASLGKALEDSRFEISDRDRSAGIYYVRFLGQPGEEEDDGWFDWMFGDDDDHPLTGRDFEVRAQADGDDATTIRLLPAEEISGFDSRQEKALLSLIKGNIS